MEDYKKILEGVVNIINTTEKSDIGFANICSYIGENCLELKDSNDERIRKGIIKYLEQSQFGEEHYCIDDDIVRDYIAWLEAQGELKKIEQKPTWSEEDEIGLGDALWAIEQARTIAKDENDMGNLWYAERWLKSLKDRN